MMTAVDQREASSWLEYDPSLARAGTHQLLFERRRFCYGLVPLPETVDPMRPR